MSILSYAGDVCIGIATDAGLVPDPEAIVAGFQTEFDELTGLLRQVERDDGAKVHKAADTVTPAGSSDLAQARGQVDVLATIGDTFC